MADKAAIIRNRVCKPEILRSEDGRKACGEMVDRCLEQKDTYVLNLDHFSISVSSLNACLNQAFNFAVGGYSLRKPGTTSGHIQRSYAHYAKKRLVFRELPAAEPMKVNRSLPHYFSRRSRARGEKDLADLCRRADVEEAFLHAEGVDAQGKKFSVWYEVGQDESTHSVWNTADGSFIRSAVLSNPGTTRISWYHIHPGKTNKNRFGYDFPSPGDYVEILNKARRHRAIPRGVEFDYRVVTVGGVWTLEPNLDAIDEDYELLQASANEYQSLFITFARVEGPNRRTTMAEKRERFLSLMSVLKYVKFIFEPITPDIDSATTTLDSASRTDSI